MRERLTKLAEQLKRDAYEKGVPIEEEMEEMLSKSTALQVLYLHGQAVAELACAEKIEKILDSARQSLICLHCGHIDYRECSCSEKRKGKTNGNLI